MSDKTKLKLEKLTTQIRGLISQSAKAKIEIGRLLNEHIKDIEYGGKEAFYESIGMPNTTAQYYRRIATKIDELEAEGKEVNLEELNMTEILKIINARVNVRGDNNENHTAKKEWKFDDNFDFNKCRSTAQFKVQYEVLDNRVKELESELDSLKSKSA